MQIERKPIAKGSWYQSSYIDDGEHLNELNLGVDDDQDESLNTSIIPIRLLLKSNIILPSR